MTGFSDTWLSARAAWDGPARNRTVEAALRAWAAARPDRLVIVDLGAGNGNNQRHLAPLFSQPVDWLLVDNDPALLTAAEQTAVLKEADRIACKTVDLASADLAKLIAGADLVTASALFDLVSAPWLGRLLDALAARGTALFSVLTYDGRMQTDAVPADTETVRDLVNWHQRTDKGFGPALGPDVAVALSRGLVDRSYNPSEGDSDWCLRSGDPGAAELIRGWVSAASEMAPENSPQIDAWAAAVMTDPGGLIHVGHRDHFAVPRIS
ncbi:class I SAM-dependent methyltransferase [Nisaea sp.]|uniref:class I SAM-dependent methyltransferase n=1 Tax=Nisaea sp. TaxID=2024842 RepID=UPI0032EDF2D5